MENIFEWLKSPRATFIFAIIAVAGGFMFLDKGLTGNVVSQTPVPTNFVSVIGLLLIFCSLILVAYSIKNRK